MSNLRRTSRQTTAPARTGDRYLYGFTIPNSAGTANYRISFDAAPGAMYWTCSCRGCIAHGQCKHLTAAGLQGRKFGAQSLPTPNQGRRAQSNGRALPAGG